MEISPDSRRGDLLYRARISRLKWINDAADLQKQKSDHTSVKRTHVNQCVQDVISFLTLAAGDCQVTEVESLIPPQGLGDTDEKEEKIPLYEEGCDSYSLFLSRLQHTLAMDIVKSMQGFVLKLETNIHMMRQEQGGVLTESQHNEISQQIQSFHTHITKQMKANGIWSTDSESQWEWSCEACEKFLFVKLYPLLLANEIEGAKDDDTLHQRLVALKFVTAVHLDLPMPDALGAASTEEAVRVIREMETWRCPSDK
eukprot:gene38671-50796_t